jgi:phosphoribosylformylglycinamidine cyclo-ligase
MDTNTHTYQAAGVDIEKAEKFVHRLKARARRTQHDSLWEGAGGYASVVPIDQDTAMALTTDGVGTKLLVALEYNQLTTIGIDLVAMCANDLVCVGATPTAFLDYYATPRLNDEQADSIIEGIVAGCDQAGMLLVGGETAELPDLYAENHFDLAGFAAGTVTRQALLTGDKIAPGDKVIGVASTGIHSNGLSLARKVFPVGDKRREQLLNPTAIYVKPMLEALTKYSQSVHGAAHITGGGWRNLLRLNRCVGFTINKPLPLPEVYKNLLEHIEAEEMYKTFNMGMGFAIIVGSNEAQIIELFKQHGFSAGIVGNVSDNAGKVIVDAETHLGTKTTFTLLMD